MACYSNTKVKYKKLVLLWIRTQAMRHRWATFERDCIGIYSLTAQQSRQIKFLGWAILSHLRTIDGRDHSIGNGWQNCFATADGLRYRKTRNYVMLYYVTARFEVITSDIVMCFLSFRITSLAAGPSYACSRASGISLKYMGYIDHYLIAIYNTSHNVRITFLCVVFRIGQIIDHWLFHMINKLRPRQNGGQFPKDIFKCVFLNKNISILIKMPLNLFFMVQLTIFQHWFR